MKASSPIKNTSFCPISASDSNLNPRNIQYMDACPALFSGVAKIFALLDLDKNWAFFKGLVSTVIISSLCLSLFLLYGCSKEEDPIPPVQSIKIVKPIKMPELQKNKPASINQQIKHKPQEKELKEEKIATVNNKRKERKESVFNEPQAQVSKIKKFKEIKDIQFSKTKNNEDMVTFFLNGNHTPRIFPTKKGTPRVVCDFIDTRLSSRIARNIKVNGNSIQQIRIGLHKGHNSKTRVVLDLAPHKNNDYQVQPVLFKDKNLFAILVKKTL